MKLFRIALAALTALGFGAWFWLRQPYSPTQDLPAISLTAFNLASSDPELGQWLALQARTWPGVTASTYNPVSQLIVLAHTETQEISDLQQQLQAFSSVQVSQKIFPEPSGPKCPVPQSALATVPTLCLAVASMAALLLTLTFMRRFISKGRPSGPDVPPAYVS